MYCFNISNCFRLHESNQRSEPRSSSAFDWNDYSSHKDINAYIADQVDDASSVRIENIGQSYEGRDMDVLVIEQAGSGAPIVWIEAGIHAREWISPAVATWLIKELLADNGKYTSKINFHILPVANPDGYEYSRNSVRKMSCQFYSS